MELDQHSTFLDQPFTYTFTQGAGGSMTTNNPTSSTDGIGSTIATPGGSVKESVLGGGGGGGHPFPNSTYVYGRPGASGGGAGGGPWPTDGPQIHPQWPERGWQPPVPGGSGVPGQGNSGGRAGTGYVGGLSSPRFWIGGGGGGAGGSGGKGNLSNFLLWSSVAFIQPTTTVSCLERVWWTWWRLVNQFLRLKVLIY